MQSKKLATAQKRYEKAKAQTQLCKAALSTGGSYTLWRMALVEEDEALRKLQAVQAEMA
jgi:hypothetical protein